MIFGFTWIDKQKNIANTGHFRGDPKVFQGEDLNIPGVEVVRILSFIEGNLGIVGWEKVSILGILEITSLRTLKTALDYPFFSRTKVLVIVVV